MWEAIRQQPVGFVLALLLHLALVAALLFGYHRDTPQVVVSREPVIDAYVMADASTPSTAEPVPRLPEPEPLAPVPPADAVPAPASLKPAPVKPTQHELASQPELSKRQQVEQASQRELEQKRLAVEAETRRKAQEEELRRRADELRRKQDDDRRRAAEDDLRRSLEEEERQLVAAAAERDRQRREEEARQRRINDAMAKYVGLITGKVERHWIRPAESPSQFNCIVRVQLMPGGAVVRASVVKSCGSVMLDRSVESAVYKASPLPVPSEPEIFSAFKEIQFNFKPNS